MVSPLNGFVSPRMSTKVVSPQCHFILFDFILFSNVLLCILVHVYSLCFIDFSCCSVSYYNYISVWPYYIVIQLYCSFINGLLKELRDLNVGCTINGIFTCAMCQADDLAVVCVYEAFMQRTLDVIFAHSCHWKYNHNPSTCMCSTYGQELQHYNTCTVYIGVVPFPKVNIYIHVGVALCNNDNQEKLLTHNASEYTASRMQRGKISIFPMLGLVKSGQTLKPIVASKGMLGCSHEHNDI